MFKVFDCHVEFPDSYEDGEHFLIAGRKTGYERLDYLCASIGGAQVKFCYRENFCVFIHDVGSLLGLFFIFICVHRRNMNCKNKRATLESVYDSWDTLEGK